MARTTTNLKKNKKKIIVQNVKGRYNRGRSRNLLFGGRGGLIFDSENIIETLFLANYLFNNSSP